MLNQTVLFAAVLMSACVWLCILTFYLYIDSLATIKKAASPSEISFFSLNYLKKIHQAPMKISLS